MKRRIYGGEFEVGMMPYEFICQDGIVNKAHIRLIFKHAPLSQAMRKFEAGDGDDTFGAYLLNEARFYCDTNFHLEYSTPETRSPRDCVRWEKAGERIFEGIAEKINREESEAKEWQHLGGISFFKNNTDHIATDTWGCHENFLVERRVDIADLGEALVPFLASAPLWNGSGKVIPKHDGRNQSLGFILSQRAPFMKKCLGPGATSDRAMVNTRDEPHADKEKWRRLEILANDSHMSEIVSWLDYSLIGLIIEMVEAGFLKPRTRAHGLPMANIDVAWLTFKDEVNADLSLNKSFMLGSRMLRALDVQRLYLEVMRKYERAEGVSPEQKDALGRFEALLGKIERVASGEEPETSLTDVCDWAAKRAIIAHDALRYRYSIHAHPKKVIEFVKNQKVQSGTLADRLFFLDLAFHDMRRARGLHYALERKGLRERLLSDEEIDSAIYSAPANTRAAWRKWWQEKAEAEVLAIRSWGWTAVQAVLPLGYQGPAKRGFVRSSLDPFVSDPDYNELYH